MGSQLNILSEKERREIYDLPKFKKKQQSIYLEFTLSEQELIRTYKSPVTKVYFLLQLAYFKFKQQFFVFNLNQVAKDVKHNAPVYSSIAKYNRQLPTSIRLQTFHGAWQTNPRP